MAPLVIDRTTPMDTVLSFFYDVHHVTVREKGDGRVVLSPLVDPADYANDTEYLNAIPGMAESLIKSMNAPMSEFIDYDELWDDTRECRKSDEPTRRETFRGVCSCA